MSAGPIYQFTREYAWASNFDETRLVLPAVEVGPEFLPDWQTRDGLATIAKITEGTPGLVPCGLSADGGLSVPGVERPFQASKTQDVEKAALILGAPTPHEAKKKGLSPERGGLVDDLRPGWTEDLLGQRAMLYLTGLKYQNERLMHLLIRTGYRLMVEGNNHRDTIWGAVWARPSEAHRVKGPRWGSKADSTEEELRGQNWLGRILMYQRAQFDMGLVVEAFPF
jgi:predicted NAD-dependent protein-ADP-ribosyltransferase YbiA (DUF1768 family)